MAEALEVFRGIGQLVSLASAAKREGRHANDADLSSLENAALVAENGKIKWLGPEAKLPDSYRRKKATDLKGKVVIPGLVEPHTHLIFAGNRSAEFEKRNQGVGYQQIAEAGGGILATVRATRAASEKQLGAIGQKRTDRFLKQGVTTIEVKSGYGLTLDEEMKMLRAAKSLKGARIVPTFLGAHAKPAEYESADSYIDYLVQTALPRIKKEKLATRVDVFIEKGYFSTEMAKRYLRAAEKLGLQGSIHADQMTLSGGARLAVELGAKSADHLVQLGAEEIEILAKSDVTCVLLPSADLYM
ncbi:MAG: imidazolonepropionase, partial [Proteobacteria bacterium]